MIPQISILVDIPNIKILKSEMNEKGEYIIWVESTMEGTACHKCSEPSCKFHGKDKEITIRHLPILGRPTYLKMRPLRYECESCTERCKKRTTTTQRVGWYNPKNSLSLVYEEHLLLDLVNSTVKDVSIKEQIGYGTVRGLLKHRINVEVDWSKIEKLEVVGIDEIALRKGHKHYVVIVTARNSDGRIILLAVLGDRKKETVKEFLESIPAHLQESIHTVCSDMWDAYVNAADEVFNHPHRPSKDIVSDAICEEMPPKPVSIVIDRFHVAKKYREALENVRKKEMRRLKAEISPDEYKQFKNIRWILRKNYSDLDKDEIVLLERLFVLSPTLKQVYAFCHQLTSLFDTHYTPSAATKKLEQWRQQVLDSGLNCFDSFLNTLDNHFEHILNYFDRRFNSGFVEGLNNKVKVLKRRCYGILNPKTLFQRLFLDLNGYRLFLPEFA